MATTAVTLNGVTYFVPQPGEQGPTYDQDLTNYLVALATAFPQGGASPSSTFQALVSATANPATAGAIRLGKTDLVDWRNQANTGNDAISVDANDNLNWTSSAASPVFFSGLAQQITGNPVCVASTATAQSLTGSATTQIIWTTAITDSDLGLNTGTGTYTVPAGKGGDYLIAFDIGIAVPSSTAVNIFCQITVGGVSVGDFGQDARTTDATQVTLAVNGSVIYRVTPGTTIGVSAVNGTATARSLETFATRNRFMVKRLV